MSDKIDYVKFGIGHGTGGVPSLKTLFRAGFAGLVLFAAGPPSAAGGLCPSDANNDNRVTIAEVVLSVRHALDGCPVGSCNGDVDEDGSVMVAELVRAVIAALEGCGDDSGLVVDVAWLLRRLGSPAIQVLDSRLSSFERGHIPGAIPLRPTSLATVVDGVPSQIVLAEDGIATLSSMGLRPGAIAVVYGQEPEYDPARVVWALSYLGHAEVRYLDGGWPAWLVGGGGVAAGDPIAPEATTYDTDGVRDELRVTGAWVLEQLGDEPYEDVPVQIVDARSPPEYENGFIPTAVLRQWTNNLDDDGLLLPMATLETLYSDLDKTRTTVVYCTAGWRASVAWLVLTELGFEDVRVFDGSWLEWGDPDLGFPIAFPPLTEVSL